jgi:hypothetical protein
MLLLESGDIWFNLQGASLRCLLAACSASLRTHRLEVSRSLLLHLPDAVFLPLLWPKWCRPRRWCGGRRRSLVGLLEMEVKDLIAF